MRLIKVIGFFILLFVLINGFMVIRFYDGKSEVRKHNTAIISDKISLPEVDLLKVMPIVDNRAVSGLRIEDAVSYLVKTKHESILFDVAWNKKSEKSSPLISNMEKLGLTFSDFTALVISHNHPDHVGGMGFRKKVITTGVKGMNLSIYTPIAMTSEGVKTNLVSGPAMINKEVASTGPLAEQMYVTGRIYEQALMINVKGKGLVLIVGCGHPQINNIVEDAKIITGLPVYAVVGGTHLFYTSIESAFWRRIMGSTKIFARGTTRHEVEKTVDLLRAQGVKKVFISGHDADQASLNIFESRFGHDYQVVTAGNPIQF